MAPNFSGMSMFCRTVGILAFVCSALQWTSGDAITILCMSQKQARLQVSAWTTHKHSGR